MFENAEFGDKFKTREGHIVIFVDYNPIRREVLTIHNQNCVYGERHYNLDGSYRNDGVEDRYDVISNFEK